jgi:hypothetical protein
MTSNQQPAPKSVCRGARCGQEDDDPPRVATAGSWLCDICRIGLIADMRSLPYLYERCGHEIDAVRCPHCSRPRGSGDPAPLIAAAAAARERIVDLLVLLCRTIAAPEEILRGRSVGALVDFAVSRVDALAQREAAPLLTLQVAHAALGAHRVIHPESFRHGGVRAPGSSLDPRN